jgi:hypothetical protein
MTTSNTKQIYYNGWWWRTRLLADGTRTVQPFRTGGGPAARTTTRYYRRPVRVHSSEFPGRM